MKQLAAIFLVFIFCSCIPTRIAPKIDDYDIKVAEKFKRKLPKNYAFIFEDPKEEGAFYNFINYKYDLISGNVGKFIPFSIEDEDYYLSYDEVVIEEKYLNFTPVIFEALIGANSDDEGAQVETDRYGHWYFVITILDTEMADCLNPKYKNRIAVINYLRHLKLDYLNEKAEVD